MAAQSGLMLAAAPPLRMMPRMRIIRAHLLTQDADRVVHEHLGVERVDALLGRAAVAGIRRANMRPDLAGAVWLVLRQTLRTGREISTMKNLWWGFVRAANVLDGFVGRPAAGRVTDAAGG